MDLMDYLYPDQRDRIFPLHIEQRFAPQRAPDMWFGDELPPTYQDYLNRPDVVQAKAFVRVQLLQEFARMEERAALQNDPAAQKKALRKFIKQRKAAHRQSA